MIIQLSLTIKIFKKANFPEKDICIYSLLIIYRISPDYSLCFFFCKGEESIVEVVPFPVVLLHLGVAVLQPLDQLPYLLQLLLVLSR
jgi:hypothetical protein